MPVACLGKYYANAVAFTAFGPHFLLASFQFFNIEFALSRFGVNLFFRVKEIL